MVFYQQFVPSPALRDAIECFWIFKASFPRDTEKETLMPGGRIECMFSFASSLLIGDEDRMPDAFIMGQRDRVFFARQTGETDMMGIRFKPGGLASFSHQEAAGLLNRVLPAHAVLDFITDELTTKLRSAVSDRERVDAADAILLQHKRSPTLPLQQAREMIHALRNVKELSSLEDYCARHHIHYKKLERIFLKYVGYTPKTYLRVLRFNRALRGLHDAAHLTSLAYEAGYYDQSHFIRDFHCFAGMPPGEFDPVLHTVPGLLMHHQPV